jgi:hypothetical protein
VTPSQYCEVLNAVFSAAAIERQAQHPGSSRYLCEIGGQVVFTHNPLGNVVRVL